MLTVNYKSEKGQSVVLLALVFVALLGFAALALDSAEMYVARRNAQAASDAAALAGALAKSQNQNWKSIALERAASNGYDNDGVTNWVTVASPPTSGQYQGNDQYLQVTISQIVDTSFLHFVFPTPVQITVSTVVRVVPPQPLTDHAIFAASESECDAMVFSGNVDVNVLGGDVFSNSNANSKNCPSLIGNGNVDVRVHAENGGVFAVGHIKINGNVDFEPTYRGGMPQEAVLSLPVPDCNLRSNYSNNTSYIYNKGSVNIDTDTTLEPGLYNHISIGSNANVRLEPGLYCIRGDFTKKGNGWVIGDDVLLVLLGGSFDLQGNSEIRLKAPAQSGVGVFTTVNGSTHDYRGLLIFADPSRYSPSSGGEVRITGNSDVYYQGTLYAPQTQCRITGNNDSQVIRSQIICRKIGFHGNTNLTIDFRTSDNYTGISTLEIAE